MKNQHANFNNRADRAEAQFHQQIRIHFLNDDSKDRVMDRNKKNELKSGTVKVPTHKEKNLIDSAGNLYHKHQPPGIKFSLFLVHRKKYKDKVEISHQIIHITLGLKVELGEHGWQWKTLVQLQRLVTSNNDVFIKVLLSLKVFWFYFECAQYLSSLLKHILTEDSKVKKFFFSCLTKKFGPQPSH